MLYEVITVIDQAGTRSRAIERKLKNIEINVLSRKDFAELTGKPHGANQEVTAGFMDMEVFPFALIKFLFRAASLIYEKQ